MEDSALPLSGLDLCSYTVAEADEFVGTPIRSKVILGEHGNQKARCVERSIDVLRQLKISAHVRGVSLDLSFYSPGHRHERG